MPTRAEQYGWLDCLEVWSGLGNGKWSKHQKVYLMAPGRAILWVYSRDFSDFWGLICPCIDPLSWLKKNPFPAIFGTRMRYTRHRECAPPPPHMHHIPSDISIYYRHGCKSTGTVICYYQMDMWQRVLILAKCIVPAQSCISVGTWQWQKACGFWILLHPSVQQISEKPKGPVIFIWIIISLFHCPLTILTFSKYGCTV
jgi:hypothetical protein